MYKVIIFCLFSLVIFGCFRVNVSLVWNICCVLFCFNERKLEIMFVCVFNVFGFMYLSIVFSLFVDDLFMF